MDGIQWYEGIFGKTEIEFDKIFQYILFQIEFNDGYTETGVFNIEAAADLKSFDDGVRKYLKKQSINEIEKLLTNGVGKKAEEIKKYKDTPLKFTKDIVDLIIKYDPSIRDNKNMNKFIKNSLKYSVTLEKYDLHTIRCPVDIYVYDKNGEILLGSIIDDIVSENNTIYMYLDGEAKCFELPHLKEYTIKLVGNDIGFMTYSISEYDQDNVYIQTTDFYNVDLSPQLTYTVDKMKINNIEEFVLESNQNEIISPDLIYEDKADEGILIGTLSLPGSDTGSVILELLDSSGNVIETVESSDGKYSFSNIEAGEYSIRASGEKYCPRIYEVTVDDSVLSLDISINKYGDVNSDGITEAKDATQILRYEAGYPTQIREADKEIDEYIYAVANVLGNGTLTAKDATQILRYEAGLPSIFDAIA